MKGGTSQGMSRPPEGVICGENVPVGSETRRIEEQRIEDIQNTLKGLGEPYISMTADELRERALELYQRCE